MDEWLSSRDKAEGMVRLCFVVFGSSLSAINNSSAVYARARTNTHTHMNKYNLHVYDLSYTQPILINLEMENDI